MDVTPQELRGGQVKEAFHGYHREEVDALLERAAATIENLTDQLQRPHALSPSLVNQNDADTIQRTLLLAQRATDNTMAEAEENTHVLVEESESKAQALVSDAETNARRIHDEEMRRHEAEITALLARSATGCRPTRTRSSRTGATTATGCGPRSNPISPSSASRSKRPRRGPRCRTSSSAPSDYAVTSR